MESLEIKNVTVLFFASLREQLGRQLELPLDAPLTVGELAERLRCDYSAALSGSLCAVNEVYAGPNVIVKPGDTVAFFPPVAGG